MLFGSLLQQILELQYQKLRLNWMSFGMEALIQRPLQQKSKNRPYSDYSDSYFKMTQLNQSRVLPPTAPIRAYHPYYKFMVVTLLIAGFALYRFIYSNNTLDCIKDTYQTATLEANRAMALDPSKGAVYEGSDTQLSMTGKVLIGIGQVLMDLWIAIFAIIWLIKIKNVRPLIAFALFFVIRGVIFLNVQRFPYPKDIVWKSPGFFAFTVPYDHTRDFFYSGHTGTLTIIFLEMVNIEYRAVAILVFLSLVFMMNMLLITEVHYVADVIGGLVFATWFYRTSIRVVFYTDFFFSLPFLLVKKIVRKCTEEHPTPSSVIPRREIVTERDMSAQIRAPGTA